MHKIGAFPFLFAGFFAIAATGALTAGAAESQEKAEPAYPLKPIRIISPLAPGGSADAIARMVGEALADAFGQPVVVDTQVSKHCACLWKIVPSEVLRFFETNFLPMTERILTRTA